jgi:hypothetical protein
MPVEEKVWEEMVKNILRAEMMRRGVSYAGLAERLQEHGIEDNELNLRNKVSRGRFTAVFFMQCMQALGVELLQIPQTVEEAGRKGGAQALTKGKGASRPITDSMEKRSCQQPKFIRRRSNGE